MTNSQRQGNREMYRIRVKGNLDAEWADWFNGFSILPQTESETLLTGRVADQADLYGLLAKIRDLGLPLLLVEKVDCDNSRELKRREE